MSKWVPKEFLPEEDFKRFCERAKEENLFWSSLLLFLAFTGCRVSEAVKLKWEDINFKDSVARIWKSKGQRSRWVPLKDEVLQLLQKRREALLKKMKEQEIQQKYVWPGRNGHITRLAVYRKVQKIGQELGIKIHPHTLRHTFLTLLINKGVPIHVVKEIAGHSSLAVTGVYLHTSPTQLKKAVEVI
jgi:integrase/recombinase XerD